MTGACAAIVGAYWEDNKLYDQTGWMYKTIPPCTSNGAAGHAGQHRLPVERRHLPRHTVQNPGVQGDNTSFYQDQCARPSRRLSSPRSTST